MLKECHMKFYKSSSNFNSNRTTYKECFGVWEHAFVMFDGLFFWIIDPSTLEGHNFLNFIPFLTVFIAPYVQIGGVQILFGHQK
jgi:hypothetical protein